MMHIAEAQALMRALYGPRDAARGTEETFLWFLEEVGELSEALRGKGRHTKEQEFADVLAWLASLANIAGVDLERALLAKYPMRCPRCRGCPCACAPA
jgi:NTP pyrophosphatase (non-canonical NTP hydrolase)